MGGRDPKRERAQNRRGARGESTSHTSLPKALIEYIEGLVLAQGRYAGEPFILDSWEKRFIRMAFGQSGDAGLSLGRGNGKTTFKADYPTIDVEQEIAASFNHIGVDRAKSLKKWVRDWIRRAWNMSQTGDYVTAPMEEWWHEQV